LANVHLTTSRSLAPTFEEHGIEFVHAEATSIDLVKKVVRTSAGSQSFDYLVIATGYRDDFDVIPGLGPGGNAFSITTLDAAIHTGIGWKKFLEKPGDIVVGATQGAGCFRAAYEFFFNTAFQLKKAGLKKQVKLTYVTAEPFLGHFGIGGLPHGESLLGMFLKKEKITAVIGVAMDHVDEGRLVLADGQNIDFAFSMIIPPFLGQEVITKLVDIADAQGYVKVRDTYQTETYDNVYAVGAAAAVDIPWQTSTPVGIPKTGFPTEQQAHIAAKNIAAQIRGDLPNNHKAFGEIPAVCVMDAGDNGVIILADHMLPPRKHGVLIPGPQAHAMKIAFEKYFLWKAKHGHVMLP
jgi:NADH dehydrogenase FAD-containing subunit